jgi:hypothetical protein
MSMQNDAPGTLGIKIVLFALVAIVVAVAASAPMWLPAVKKLTGTPAARSPTPEPMGVILDHGAKSPTFLRPGSRRPDGR